MWNKVIKRSLRTTQAIDMRTGKIIRPPTPPNRHKVLAAASDETLAAWHDAVHANGPDYAEQFRAENRALLATMANGARRHRRAKEHEQWQGRTFAELQPTERQALQLEKPAKYATMRQAWRRGLGLEEQLTPAEARRQNAASAA